MLNKLRIKRFKSNLKTKDNNPKKGLKIFQIKINLMIIRKILNKFKKKKFYIDI
jgi:hypothetical protein